MSAPKILSKISYKTVCGKVNRRELPADGSSKLVMRVLGQASAMKNGNTDFGEFTAFVGMFEATNVETGEVSRSGKIFLPSAAEVMLAGALQGSTGPVAFGFDIGVRESDNAIGYEYTAESIFDVAETDPVEQMKKTMTAKALPAPTKTQEQAKIENAAAESTSTPAPEAETTAKKRK
jgi:hypothetical protein